MGSRVGARGGGASARGARARRGLRAEALQRPRMGDGPSARRCDHPQGRPLRERHRCRGPRVHGLHAGGRSRPRDADPGGTGVAGPRMRRSLEQDVRRVQRCRTDRPGGRHRVAEAGQAPVCRRRRLLQRLPGPHGLGLLLEQAGRAGPALHRQHLRRRVEGLPAGGAGQARRALYRLTGKGKGDTRSVTGNKRLGIGFVGSGFNARFHFQGRQTVRDAVVLGVWRPNGQHAEDMAARARRIALGPATAQRSIAEMVADPGVDALWLCGPNQARIENVEEIVDAVTRGKGALKGIAREKPLARNVAEAQRVTELVKKAGLAHGYLENQLFAPAVSQGRAIIWARGASLTGRPYLARAAEEHSGPHMPWFWRGDLQGGGVLNDMMCHSALVVRHLLTKPGAALSTVKPVRVTAHIASLKWSQPHYAKQLSKRFGKEVNYAKTPAEDFASTTIEFETSEGQTVIGEASTSWSFVGAGLRLSAELLGPEYSLSWNSLDAGLKLFFSREVKGKTGEDLVEKQNAEMGLLPVVANEAAAYGYEAEDRHFVRVFLGLEAPQLTFDDGVEVVKLLMTAYMSAEQGKTLEFPPKGIETFVPAVAKGEWKP